MISIPNKLDPILWVGGVSPIRMPQFFPFQKNEVEIIFKASCVEALPLLRSQKFSSILVQDIIKGEGMAFFEQAMNLQPMAPRLFIAEDFTEDEVRQGINKAQIFRFLRWPLSEREVWKLLESALLKHSILLSRSNLLKESTGQNRQLEALTHSLEEIVDDRTKYIEISHQEEQEKLTRERHLIRFIKDLASQTSFEEILGILRKELLKSHKMRDPILAYRLGGDKTFFMSFQLGHFTQTETFTRYNFPRVPELASSEVIQYFANHFGRPFVKAYLVPLELRLTSRFVKGAANAVLCLENSMTDKEISPFVDFISDRISPLSMALDRVLLENQLSIFTSRWEETFEGMRDPIAIVNTEYNVVRANGKFSDKFIHHKCYESFTGSQTPCEGCPARAALETGTPQTGQVQSYGKIYQVHSYPVVGESGGNAAKATEIVNQYVDITQSRELYLRMLQNEKMGAIGMLAGNIAHELNNPLTGLRSLSQVLLQEVSPADGNLKSDLLEIEKATARSQKIIKNLLDFSKGDDQPADFVAVDELVERTLPMLKSALRTHGLEVDLNAAEALVFAEPHLLQQVVFNIINNACQAMKSPGKLKISTLVKSGTIVLSVEDSGPGIPSEIQHRIFEPFFTTKKEGHGTGLGLSMSKSVIEKYGGQISVRNVEPHGSCFTIVLPQKSPGDTGEGSGH
jgi:two-component system NtrC family sensor kinase